jgi:MinD-like ATPase involved in chromosome partitioning or flagellar assembly
MVVRDATGFLCFVAALPAPSEAKRKTISDKLRASLSAYARPDRVIIFSNDPGAERLLKNPDYLIIQVNDGYCRLLDRRIVGSSWMESPVSTKNVIPRVVFASLKGGVGRSTALVVAASDFAMRGRNVLVIDLDLEAPGLGDLILTADRKPKLGVLDYLVENGIGGISDATLSDFIGTSPLTVGGGGRVDVMPALGSRSIEFPENVLPKLARSMLENLTHVASPKSVGVQISEMIDRFVTRETYDVVLIDSRAGLSELAAPAVLGLGAIVLLFGTAQEQTIAGYEALFAALKLLAIRDLEGNRSADWRLMFKPIYAKASLDAKINRRHLDDLYELFANNLYDATSLDNSPDSNLNFSADDPDAPHAPLIIPFDPRFVDFDPFRNRDHLAISYYEQTFRSFMDGLERIIEDTDQATKGASA